MSDALLGMVGTGISLIGGLTGLISGASAEHQAEQAAERAITDFKTSSADQYQALLSGGTAGLSTLSGGLNNALVTGGRSLGAALAGTGVYNSSAAAGALANQASANAAVEGNYSTNLANELLQQKNQTGEQAAQMQYGLSTNNLNYARQQQAGSEAGLNQLFGNLGQINFGHTGGTNGQGGTVNTSSVLPPTNGIVVPNQNQYSPMQGGGLGGGGGSF